MRARKNAGRKGQKREAENGTRKCRNRNRQCNGSAARSGR